MSQYTISIDDGKRDTLVTPEEEKIVHEKLELFASTSEAVTYLYERGWPTSSICDVIHYPNGGRLDASYVDRVIVGNWFYKRFLDRVKRDMDWFAEETMDDGEYNAKFNPQGVEGVHNV